MSILHDVIEDISSRGYRVLDNGDVISPKGVNRSLYTHKSRYKYFGVKYLKKVYTIPVAWLQAFQKFGDTYSYPGVEVRHLNGDPGDNTCKNIEIGTHSQNMLDRSPADRVIVAIYAASKRRKLSEEAVRQLRLDREDGATYQTLMEKFGIAKSTVSGIVNNKTYKL